MHFVYYKQSVIDAFVLRIGLSSDLPLGLLLRLKLTTAFMINAKNVITLPAN